MGVGAPKVRGRCATVCIAALLLCAFSMLSGCVQAAGTQETTPPENKFRVVYAADFEFAPFRVETDEGYFGYEIDVNTRIFADTKYELDYQFQDLAIDNLEELAKDKSIDIFGWRVITPATQEYMLLSDPVYEFNWGAVTLQSFSDQQLDAEEYFKHKIGIVNKKYPYNYLVTQLGVTDYVIYERYEEAAQALVDGDIDIWFEEREIVNYYIARASHFSPPYFHEETCIEVPVGLLIRPDLTELHATINEQIAKMKRDGELETFYLRHFQKHSEEFLASEAARTRNIMLVSAGAILVLFLIVLYILHINRRYARTSEELSRTFASLEEAKEQFSAAVDGANDGILYYSRRTGKLVLSERFCQLFHLPHKKRFELKELEAMLLGKVHPKHHAEVRAFAACFGQEEETAFNAEFLLTDPDAAQWVSLRVKFEYNGDNWVGGGTLSDITERKEAEAQTLFFARHDYLTGIFNRMYLIQLSADVIGAARESGSDFATLYIDLDNFKKINDNYGHDYGDEALKLVVKTIQEMLPPDAILARVGGDEFVVLLPGRHAPADVCVEMNRQVARLCVKDVLIGASIGVSRFPQDAVTIEELIVKADLASRAAKTAGKNGFTFYEPDPAS